MEGKDAKKEEKKIVVVIEKAKDKDAKPNDDIAKKDQDIYLGPHMC